VSDLLLLVRSAVEEAAALIAWGRAENYASIALGGYSMGAYVSLLTATMTPGPLTLFPLSAGIAPAPVFTSGMLSRLVDWKALGDGGRDRLAAVLTVGDLRRRAPLTVDKSVHILALERDGFIARADTEELARHIPGAEVRYVPGHGHVSAVVSGRKILLPFVRDRL
jgi:pimeloyl-ACP methyl ester carboxylesterase